MLGVSAARMSADGSVIVFATEAPLTGFNNGGGLDEEIYRYSAATEQLSCVSCPPAGITPTGNARISMADQLGKGGEVGEPDTGPVDERGISADGSPGLLRHARPARAAGRERDARCIQWEDGNVNLISSGQSPHESLFLDNGEDGNDVFFATTDALATGDTDGGYDVYDARIPHPGDNPPPAAVPCQGAVCQGPPSVPFLSGAPASATFTGAGNLAAPGPKPSTVKKVKRKGIKKKHRGTRRRVKKGKDKRAGRASVSHDRGDA